MASRRTGLGNLARGEPLDQPAGDRGGEQRVAVADHPDGGDQVLGRDVLEQEAAGPRGQRRVDILVQVERGQDDDPQSSASGTPGCAASPPARPSRASGCPSAPRPAGAARRRRPAGRPRPRRRPGSRGAQDHPEAGADQRLVVGDDHAGRLWSPLARRHLEFRPTASTGSSGIRPGRGSRRRPRAGVEVAAEEGEPLPQADQPAPAAAPGRRPARPPRRQPRRSAARPAGTRSGRPRGPVGVLERVGQRLLHHAVGGQVEARAAGHARPVTVSSTGSPAALTRSTSDRSWPRSGCGVSAGVVRRPGSCRTGAVPADVAVRPARPGRWPRPRAGLHGDWASRPRRARCRAPCAPRRPGPPSR